MATQPDEQLLRDHEPAEEPASESERFAGPIAPLPTADPDDAMLRTLRRIEMELRDIRSRLDIVVRERQHQKYSIAELTGGVLQVVVIGLVLVAVAEWMYQAPLGRLLIELGLASVLQLAALTSFFIASQRN